MEQIEIERRWLLSRCPTRGFFNAKNFAVEKLKLKQFYLSPTERIRMTVNEQGETTYEHFIKEWLGDRSSLENVKTIEADVFEEYFKKAKSKIVKTRTKVTSLHNPFVYEFDHITRQEKSNVNILEVEFPKKSYADAFVLPWAFNEFVIAEITNLREFSNYSLSERI